MEWALYDFESHADADGAWVEWFIFCAVDSCDELPWDFVFFSDGDEVVAGFNDVMLCVFVVCNDFAREDEDIVDF